MSYNQKGQPNLSIQRNQEIKSKSKSKSKSNHSKKQENDEEMEMVELQKVHFQTVKLSQEEQQYHIKQNGDNVQEANEAGKAKQQQVQPINELNSKPPNDQPGCLQSQKQLIMVYLMYKQQKLSLILKKGLTFEQLLRKMYKEIYTYQKQTYSLSNVILKNLLYKISGFETFDNDILYDYRFKHKRGTIQKQKFFVPFQEEEYKKTPFKIYMPISKNVYGGYDYLIRNYSDGEWGVLTAIRNKFYSEEKLFLIRKFLKLYSQVRSVSLKNKNISTISTVNWLQSKNHIFLVSQFYPQNIQQYLSRLQPRNLLSLQIIKKIVFFICKIFTDFISMNTTILKNIKLDNFILTSDGLMRLNILNHLQKIVDNKERKKSSQISIQSIQSVKEKVNDKFYLNTFLMIIKQLSGFVNDDDDDDKVQQRKFIDKIIGMTEMESFSFQLVMKMQQFIDENEDLTFTIFPEVDYDGKLQKIVQKMSVMLDLTANENRYSITEIKQEIRRAIITQQTRKQHYDPRNLMNFLINSSTIKQNTTNVNEFKKQQQRKSNIKTKQKIFINSMMNDFNRTQNFLSTIKMNNIKSIQFYLKKSSIKVKNKMIDRIHSKYNNLFKTTQPTQQSQEFFTCTDIKKNKNNKSVKIISNKKSSQNGYTPKSTEKNSSSITTIKHQHPLRKQYKKSMYCSLNMQKPKKQSNQQNPSIPSNKQTTQTPIKPSIDPKRPSIQGIYIQKNLLTSAYNKEKFPNILLSSYVNNNDMMMKSDWMYVRPEVSSKESRQVIKKKQYGVYLEEAEKHLKHIKIVKARG